jgi:hypothetical protein
VLPGFTAGLNKREEYSMSVRTWSQRACVASLLCLLAACGGGSSTAATNTPPGGGIVGGNTTPPVIEGIASPQSVSVVTATNAGT